MQHKPETVLLSLGGPARATLNALCHGGFPLSRLLMAATWWTPSAAGVRCAGRAITRLADAGLAEVHRMTVRLHLDPLEPVLSWKPGDAAPDCRALAAFIRKLSPPPARSDLIVTPSVKAANLTGGYTLDGLAKIEHDLKLAAIYCGFVRDPRRVADAHGWRCEGELKRALPAGSPLPDAVVIDETTGHIRKIIEVATSSYSARRLRKHVDHFSSAELPFEIW